MGCTQSSSSADAVAAPVEAPPAPVEPEPEPEPVKPIIQVPTTIGSEAVQPVVEPVVVPENHPVPPPKMGFMMKEGHVVRNWKKRQFVLEAGNLTYYADASPSPPYGVGEKGRLNLAEYKIAPGFTGKLNKNILLQHKTDVSRDLLVEAESPYVRDEWEASFLQHIQFAESK